MLNKILYTSLVDISIPDGPGVNERIFLRDMARRFEDNFHAVIPTPARGTPAELDALSVTHIPAGKSVKTPWGYFLARTLGTQVLLRAIRRMGPDIVVIRVGSLPLPYFLAVRSIRLPYVLKTVADVEFRRFYETRRMGRLLKVPNQEMFDRVLEGAAMIDVVTASQRERVVDNYPHLEPRIHVIDNGVDLDAFRPRDGSERRARLGIDSDAIVVGYVGGLPFRRGGKEVIDVVEALGKTHRVRGLIVGDRGEADACREYAEARGVVDSVVIYGEAAFDEVPALMSTMNIGLSILRPEERKASEQKVRQYLAMGLCVVGTGGSNDFLRDESFARVVETERSAEVTSAVLDLLEQGPEGLAELGNRARRYAEENLSFAAKNDRRLRLWAQVVSDAYVSRVRA